ncbi:MAG: phenylalanine--tRNA ligase subunit beta, partial [Acidimicrobiaceae bacterium]|nr:phenylalanine--tRNA ligase subunit beta [Acidimicrobiaceae bacterium]
RLLALPRRSDLGRTVSRFPSSDVDLSFTLPESVAAGELEAVLSGATGDRCEWVRLIDVYRGAGLEAGTRSLSYRLRFVALDHTLDEAELAELRSACIAAAQSALPARLRA